ncbi:MAG: hypothetical protein JOZ42_07370 [Acetobacteraceae bacterium]|nr:hypothetical protein [Acetobacteraceae bacterium]
MEQAFAGIRFDPVVPVWLIAVLAAACLLVVMPALLRRARGAVWRALAFAVLLLWLTGPRLVRETREALADIGLLVVDQTASMQVGNRAALAEAARQKLQAEAGAFGDLELRTIDVPEGGNSGTRLFGAIDRALADIPRSRLAGVVAITDGQIHDIPDLAPGGAPLNVLIPAKGEQTDRRLRIIEAPAFGIVGRSVGIRLSIDDLGVAHPDGTARLMIRRDGGPARTEAVPVGREYTLDVPITRAGPTVLDLQAETLPGEVSAINNRTVVQINGVRDRLRVLLISGEPHAGERTWRRLLKADPAVDLVHFTILRPPEKDDLTPLNELALIAFPVRELFQVKISDFDLIILDRFQNRGLLPLPYLRNIADYVRNGGALLLSVGPEFTGAGSLAETPLGAVLPGRPARTGALVEEAFRPRVTPLGLRHPVTEGLEGANHDPAQGDTPGWGSWYRRITAADSRGETLMSAPDGSPLLLLDRVEQGRAALLLSDQIWLWSRGHQGGGPQAELLRRIAHWLMKEPELEEDSLTASFENGRLSIERHTTEDAASGEVSVTDPDGGKQAVPLIQAGPGRSVATLAAPKPGVWQITDGTRVAFAAAGIGNPREIADLRATATLVSALAHASGGGTHWLDDGSPGGAVPSLVRTQPGRAASGANWVGLQRRHDHLITGVAALPLLPPWLALPLILGLLLTAWQREGM